MSEDPFQLTVSAAEVYESQKVRAMFRPLAEATLREIPISTSDRVIDVACGTGALTRVVGEQVPRIERLVGTDLNEGMLSVARSLTADAKYLVEWRHADATALPFDDACFSLCFCQQGLQFFPDKPKALSEFYRILAPEGRLVITVWSDVSPFFTALSESLKRHVGADVARRSLAPFAYRNKDVISTLIKDAGFSRQHAKFITVNRSLGPAEESIPGEIAANPIGSDVLARGQSVMKRIVDEVTDALSEYEVSNGFRVPQNAHLFEAIV